MIELWFGLLCFMLITFTVLDGWNFGAGALHLIVAKTSRERRQVVAALGPAWSWLVRSREERVGFWLCRTALARDGELRIRCLLSLNMVLAVVVLGLATGQFANPLLERTMNLVTLPILAAYLIPLSVPPMVCAATLVIRSAAPLSLEKVTLAPPVDGACVSKAMAGRAKAAPALPALSK